MTLPCRIARLGDIVCCPCIPRFYSGLLGSPTRMQVYPQCQETSQWQCRSQLTPLCNIARLEFGGKGLVPHKHCGHSPHPSFAGHSSLVCWWASFTSALVSSLRLVVVFMFAFVLTINVNVGWPRVLEVAMVEATWLGSASICEGEWGGLLR